MKFDDLDRKMRVFEIAADLCVLPEVFMVARLDGRSFTRLTKQVGAFDVPFDERFRDMMVATTESLMTCGFQVTYGYTESDEISLLFAREEDTFGRKLRKFDSILAGQASARFSLLLGDVATFDCRVSQLPTPELVIDYFRWRNEDAARNALNSWCYWTLRRDGQNERQATQRLLGLSVSQKNELLFGYGINFNDLPNWQKRGIGMFWEQYDKPAVNPLTDEDVVARRRRVRAEFDLPMKAEYGSFVQTILSQHSSNR
jgi:tRNA(His) guanylyltransferase